MNNFFKPAGDLDNEDNRTSSSYFKPAGDLTYEEKISDEDIKQYLERVVSGEKIEGSLGGGMMVVSFSKLQELVEQGCNIISAEYLNSDMIVIEFQELPKNRKSFR